MSVKTKQFVIFGRVYRSQQFTAVPALELLAKKGEIEPRELLARTEVHTGVEWLRLDRSHVINDYVFDAADAVLPLAALQALIISINEHNFAFMVDWRGAKIPTRFLDGGDSVSSAHVDPMVGYLIGEDAATLQQLEEYYSLEDAFKMFDVLVARGVNKALANEAAMKEAKSQR